MGRLGRPVEHRRDNYSIKEKKKKERKKKLDLIDDYVFSCYLETWWCCTALAVV